MAFCSNCGNKLPEGIKFCPYCGTAVLPVNITDSNKSPVNNENGVYQSRPVPVTSTRLMEIPAEEIPSESESGFNKFGKFFGIGLLILAVICIICGVARSKRFGLMKTPSKSDYSSDSFEQEEVHEDDTELSKTEYEVSKNATTNESSPKSESFVKKPKNESDSSDSTKKAVVESSEEESSEEEKTDENSAGIVDPDLKAFLDSYEKFMDEYVEFMQKYSANPTDLTLLTEYADMMEKYSDFAEKIDMYDSDEMSTADAAYYLEVTTRVSQKLLKAYSY